MHDQSLYNLNSLGLLKALTRKFVLDNCMTKFNGLNYADWYEMINFQQSEMNLVLLMNEKTLQSLHIQTGRDAEKSLSETSKQTVIEFDEYDSKFEVILVQNNNAKKFVKSVKKF